MPYQHCPDCRLTTYASPGITSIEPCPRCGAQLSSQPRRFFRVAEVPIARDETSDTVGGLEPAA